ncbi:MAG TPA: amidohydrolase family protein, partial [Planctomycetaceae bacterium]
MSRVWDRRAFLHAAAATAGFGVLRSFADQPGGAPAGPIPIVDTHQHLWDLKRFNLPWLAGASETINRSFLIDDFRAATEGLNVARTVYMEVDVHPAQQVQEAEFAIGLCEDPANRVGGAVIGGYPHDKSFADYLKRFAGVKCVKGVRTVLHGERPRGLCLRPEFVDSMKRLGDAGLVFDLCMRPGELLDGAQLASKCTKTTFVLDHCGNIGVTPDPAVRPVWCEGIKAAAAQPNVVCKVSGLVSNPPGVAWTAESLAENVDFCLDAFGEDRVLFGGDWPVCLLGGTYRRWVEALTAVVKDRPEAFRRKLF